GEVLARVEATLTDPAAVRSFTARALRDLFDLVRVLARRYSARHVSALFPPEYGELLGELDAERPGERDGAYLDGIIDALVRHGRALHVIRLAVRVVRDLAIEELVVAGDCFDRGPRADRLLDYLRHQPRVAFTWGNHDAAWIGASLGQEALIAHVLRISLRYRRLSQLEEGYGITMQPLEHLVRAVYADDPATCFVPKGEGLRDKM